MESTKPFIGFSLPLTTDAADSGGPVKLSEDDMSKLEGINPLYRAMRATFKDSLGSPTLVGAEIRLALQAEEGAIAYSASQLLADLILTAEQLTANAARAQPLAHAQILSHTGMGKVLEALCTAHRKGSTRLVVCTEEGKADAPVLNPGDFIQPLREDQQSQTSTFRITGLYKDDATGDYGFFLTSSLVLVHLPKDHPSWTWNKIQNALVRPTYLIGTIARAGKTSTWMPQADARLDWQEVFPQFQEVETA